MWFKDLYYLAKPLIPRRLQLVLRKRYAQHIRRTSQSWPIAPESATPPLGFPGWPGGARFAFVITHDVETAQGQGLVPNLLEIDSSYGLRSCFNFVPERYTGQSAFFDLVRKHGSEVGVHDLHHDGKLFRSRADFMARAPRIRDYLKKWGAQGFRAAAMHHNLDWIQTLGLNWDSSTFDTDPFEPQADGVGTIFPFWVQTPDSQERYLEIPYTLVQDFTLLVLLGETNIDLWKLKIDWIAAQGGMALVNVHPDYIAFNGKPRFDQFALSHYQELLAYVTQKYAGQYINLTPSEVFNYWQEWSPTSKNSAITQGVST
jgi:hypothetical protein